MASRAQEQTLLGLCDGELDPNRHRSSFLTNKVGGHPDWLPSISRQCPRCGRCGAPLAHVVQVYCPLEASPYHRHLHLFACPGAACSGRSDCWTVLRSQCLEERTASRPAPAQEAPPAATEWCDAADDWGLEEEEEEEEEKVGWGGGVEEDSQGQEEKAAPEEKASGEEVDVSGRASRIRLAPRRMPRARRSSSLRAGEESDLLGERDDLRHARQLLREYESREGVVAAGGGGELEGSAGGGGEEKYEKTSARHGDAVFSRFLKKISPCPRQILRYSRGGEPLFVSEPPAPADAAARLACSRCGGSRTFELQLMPALVGLLRRENGDDGELEFGTVLVYTCTDSCWTPGSGAAVEEFCFVQTDPDQQLFK
ncbi:programmed cell death protein 2-like [Perca flavescens]|uniref:programmed cell death protein 2-like n=1 Tax=Perca flavescens TaxID=8167 RepID=UPI00106DFBCF|nr:programmed cell death protein 2-like [Perca flavescens]